MVKKVIPCVCLAFLCYIVFALLTACRRRNDLRQVVGTLRFEVAQFPARDYSVGEFTISWNSVNGGFLSVFHHASPDKVLWSTLPGNSFIAAASGQEHVRESRGSVFIKDRLRIVCANQTIEDIIADSKSMTIAGQLKCDFADSFVDYTFVFFEHSENQLGFSLNLADDNYDRTYLTYASSKDEHFFGFGEQFSFFDLKGKRLPVFVSEQGIGRGSQPITFLANLWGGAGGTWYTSYAVTPHYITSQMRSLFLENYEYAVFDMREDSFVQVKLFSCCMSGRILYGESPYELIEEYTGVVGRMRPLPDWILEGAVVGMQGGTDKVREIYTQLKDLEVPIAAFWLQDWVGQRTTMSGMGKQLWWNWELDEGRYPGWEDLRDELNSDGVKLMVYINPFLVDASERSNYLRNLFEEAKAREYLVKNKEGEIYLIENTDFSAAMIDLTNPDACDWMKDVIREEVISVGAWGWMADFGEALPYDAKLSSGEPASSYHNRYPEKWAQLNREVIEEISYGDQIVFFTRSGYRESPNYSTLFWLGDQLVSWDDHDGIKTAVIGLLSSGMSGFSFNHSDIGGYTNVSVPIMEYRRDKELLLRWMELNAFTSIYRTHEGFMPDANYQFYSDEECLRHFRKFANVYKAWSFYRKALVLEASDSGLPIVRHPFIHYPDDKNFYEMSYQQFMVGSEFMIAPVLDPGVDEIEAYLPSGQWVHLWTGKVYSVLDGGISVKIAAPLGEPAVFYKKNSEVASQFLLNLEQLGVLER
jgi:alpha-glucosidase